MLRVKELAQQYGIENANQFALHVGLTYPQARRYWNNDLTQYDVEALKKIAWAFRVPVRELFFEDAGLQPDLSSLPLFSRAGR